ncbi:unnamed protein product [Somion occarium]|uniref:Uncharacterized protein n=1 Tax=Somion occarium TaxID=3059160 RepID=A0ABP1D609_9APHY
MIHLDRNHSTAIAPHSKPNLIHDTSSRPDQHNALFRSSPGRNDITIYPEVSLSNHAELSSSPHPPSLPPVSSEEKLNGAVAGISQNSPTEPRSPALDSNSSLTPPPDTISPTSPTRPLHPFEASPAKAGGDLPPESTPGSAADGLDRASRASTPLSELSSAPDVETSPARHDKSETHGSVNGGKSDSDSVAAHDPNTGRSSAEGTQTALAKEEPDKNSESYLAPSQASSSSDPTGQPDRTNPGPAQSTNNQPITASGSNPATQPDPPKLKSEVSNGSIPEVNNPSNDSSSDPKVLVILEMNSYLLKVFLAYQARNIPLTDPRVQQYTTRLQSNLHWLASAADENRKTALGMIPLPIMHPPPPVEFIPMERLLQLYAELPKIFHKDVARRREGQGMHANGSVKRDRPDDASQDHAPKRQNTGDAKISTPTPTPSMSPGGSMIGHRSASQPPQSPHPGRGTPPRPMHGSSSPSMPPPPVPPGAMATLTDPRSRSQNLSGPTGMSHMSPPGDGVRHMSPAVPHTPVMPTAGPSSGPSQATIAAVQQMGAAAMQSFQIMQNPGHPVMQYINQNIPNFSSFPLQQQLQRVQVTYSALRNQQMQQQMQQQRMAGMHSPAGSGMAGFGGNPGAGVSSGSPARASPVSQQSPMGSQSGAGLYSHPNQGMGTSFDPRAVYAALTPQQQAQLQNMPPPQRQMYLMQQQQQQLMRGANPSQANNPMMSGQSRMGQAGPSGQGGLSMGINPMDTNAIPALRSNPAMPGIARSTRTPSDHAPSPLTPGQRAEDYQRAMLAQQQQQQAQRDIF